MVDALAVGQIGVGMGGQGEKSLQVVVDDFGGDILGHGLLAQFGDVLQLSRCLSRLNASSMPQRLW